MLSSEQANRLKKVGIIALVEGVKAVPGVNVLLVAGATGAAAYLQDIIAAPDLPKQARDALLELAEDYRAMLATEVRKHSNDNTLEVALTAALEILTSQGLGPDDLVREARLDATRAARLTLERAEKQLQALYDARARELTQRLVREYYRILLGDQDILNLVAAPALQALLDRLADIEAQIQPQLADILANQERLLNSERTLALRRVHWPRRSYRPSWGLQPLMLRPEYRLVEYRGQAHKQTRDELLGWLRSLADSADKRIGARLIVGPGGSGKTRLLLEVGRILEREGWFVGFLEPGAATPENAHWLTEAIAPTLLILDYAGTRRDEVDALLDALAAARNREHPFALALLERSEPDWFRRLFQQGSDPGYSGRAELALMGAIDPNAYEMPRLSAEDMPDLYRAGVSGLAAAVGMSPPDGATPDPLPDRPLYALSLALLAVAGASMPVDTGSEQSIMACLWVWELARLRTRLEMDKAMEPEWIEALIHGDGDEPGILEKLLIATSLGCAFADEQALAEFMQDRGWTPRDRFGRAPDARWLSARIERLLPAYGDESGVLGPIQPEPLADHVLARRLGEKPGIVFEMLPLPKEMQTALSALQPGQPAPELLSRPLQVLQRLDRLRQTRQGKIPAQEGEKQVEVWLLKMTDALTPQAARSFLSILDGLLPPPDRTLALRAIQSPLYRRMAELAANDAEQARALNMLGWALSALGRREEALQANEEAVALYRQLAAAQPQAFLPDLAMSLNNLGAMLSDLGRREEALEATEEAVALYQQLAQAQPQAFLPDLAMSLNNLGRNLSALGRREHALQATKEAVALHRQLAEAQPQAFLPDLATSLGAYGSVLQSMERHHAAADAFAEGVRLLTPHFLRLPQAFAPLMVNLLRAYFQACQVAGREPDQALLTPLLETLQELSS